MVSSHGDSQLVVNLLTVTRFYEGCVITRECAMTYAILCNNKSDNCVKEAEGNTITSQSILHKRITPHQFEKIIQFIDKENINVSVHPIRCTRKANYSIFSTPVVNISV